MKTNRLLGLLVIQAVFSFALGGALTGCSASKPSDDAAKGDEIAPELSTVDPLTTTDPVPAATEQAPTAEAPTTPPADLNLAAGAPTSGQTTTDPAAAPKKSKKHSKRKPSTEPVIADAAPVPPAPEMAQAPAPVPPPAAQAPAPVPPPVAQEQPLQPAPQQLAMNETKNKVAGSPVDAELNEPFYKNKWVMGSALLCLLGLGYAFTMRSKERF